MNNGWIKLHRKALDNTMLKYDHNAFILFIALLLLVNHKTGTYDCGRFQLAGIVGLNPNTTYKALKRLEKAGIVTLTSNTKYTVVHICNWSLYQGDSNTSSNNDVTTTQQRSNTKQELTIKNEQLNKVSKDTIKPKKEKKELFIGEFDLIDRMIEAFEEALGFPIKNKAAQITAGRTVIKRISKEKAMDAVTAAVACQGKEYAPQIANVVQLDKKLENLLVYYKGKGKNGNKMKVGVVE